MPLDRSASSSQPAPPATCRTQINLAARTEARALVRNSLPRNRGLIAGEFVPNLMSMNELVCSTSPLAGSRGRTVMVSQRPDELMACKRESDLLHLWQHLKQRPPFVECAQISE